MEGVYACERDVICFGCAKECKGMQLSKCWNEFRGRRGLTQRVSHIKLPLLVVKIFERTTRVFFGG